MKHLAHPKMRPAPAPPAPWPCALLPPSTGCRHGGGGRGLRLECEGRAARTATCPGLLCAQNVHPAPSQPKGIQGPATWGRSLLPGQGHLHALTLSLRTPTPSPAQVPPRLSWRPRREPGRTLPCSRILDGEGRAGAPGQGLLGLQAPGELVKAGLGPSDR